MPAYFRTASVVSGFGDVGSSLFGSLGLGAQRVRTLGLRFRESPTPNGWKYFRYPHNRLRFATEAFPKLPMKTRRERLAKADNLSIALPHSLCSACHNQIPMGIEKLKLKPSTLNPKPSTLNPQVHIFVQGPHEQLAQYRVPNWKAPPQACKSLAEIHTGHLGVCGLF